MDGRFETPAGWRAVRADFAHYCTVQKATTRLDRMLLLLRAPSLWALAVYRFGKWVERTPSRALRVLYLVLFEVVRHATGVLLHRWVEIEADVWFESYAPIFIGARRVGRGARIYGGVTLGSGGPRERRGVPAIGRDVVLCPGASVVGPVDVPDGSVVGPNTLLTSSPSGKGPWLGPPALRFKPVVLKCLKLPKRLRR